jgi:hypothetical protein
MFLTVGKEGDRLCCIAPGVQQFMVKQNFPGDVVAVDI